MNSSASKNGAEPFHGDIERLIIPRHDIASRVNALAEEILGCYSPRRDTQADLTIVAVLTGSLIFLSDLMRRLPLRIRLVVVSASSYPGQATSAGKLSLDLPPGDVLAGQEVLIVDDILDTGRTLGGLIERIASQSPTSVRTCVLVKKLCSDRPVEVKADFVGFEIEPEFVVGYGLDYDDMYRNLPDICVLRPEIVASYDTPRSENE